MKSVGKAMAVAMLTVGCGLAVAPNAMAYDLSITPVVDLTARVLCNYNTMVQPAVVSNGCATMCQPAVVAAPAPASILTDTGWGILHRPTELLNQDVFMDTHARCRRGFLGLNWY
jgi:hypothetical protein